MKATKRLLWDLQWPSPEPHQKRLVCRLTMFKTIRNPNSHLQSALHFSLFPLPSWEEGIAKARFPSGSPESGAVNGGKEALATDCKERNDPYRRPTHAGPPPGPEVCGAPQRQNDQRTPAKREANLTCLLFIRRTSSKKSRDSMVRCSERQPAAKRARWTRREEPLLHWPGSQWTGPSDA